MTDGEVAAPRLLEIAEMSEAGPGVTRLSWTQEHRQALDLISAWMKDAGLNVDLAPGQDPEGEDVDGKPGHGDPQHTHLDPPCSTRLTAAGGRHKAIDTLSFLVADDEAVALRDTGKAQKVLAVEAPLERTFGSLLPVSRGLNGEEDHRIVGERSRFALSRIRDIGHWRQDWPIFANPSGREIPFCDQSCVGTGAASGDIADPKRTTPPFFACGSPQVNSGASKPAAARTGAATCAK